ncbi:MAG: hypothetical protein AB1640_15760 [bacterium]
MEKKNIRTDPARCSECYSCQLICSLVHEGVFHPLKARIRVGPEAIRFTETCVPKCTLCTQYCAYGALTLVK